MKHQFFKTKYVNSSTAETSQVYENTIFPVVKYLYLSCSPPPLLSFSIWRVVECPSTWISYIRGNLISHFDPTRIASLMYSMTSTWNNFAFVMFAMDALSRLRLYYSIVMWWTWAAIVGTVLLLLYLFFFFKGDGKFLLWLYESPQSTWCSYF